MLLMMLQGLNLQAQVRPDSAYINSYFYEAIGDFNNAIGELSKLKDNSYQKNIRKAWLYFSLGDYENAISFYKRSDSLESNSIDAKTGLINAYYLSQKYKKCEQICYNLLTIEKTNLTALLTLANCKLINLDYIAATEYLVKALKYYPTNYSALYNIVFCYKIIGNKEKAWSYATRLMNLYPNDEAVKELCKDLSKE